MHLAIIGFGSIGKRHLRVFRALRPNARITIVRQHGPVTPSQPPEGADAITNDLDSVIAERPDAAILSGPAPNRMQAALPLAEAGVHLLSEKPIATSDDDVERVLLAAKNSGATFLVGYVLRHLPVLIALKQALADNAIGRVISLNAEVGHHIADWRPDTDYRKGVSANAHLGGGAIFELSHELDYVRWILGTPAAVTCRTQQLGDLGIDVEDTADLILDFETPATATVHLDLLQRPASRKCTVRGDKGRIEADLIAGTIHILDADTGDTQQIEVPALDNRDALYIRQAKHFLSCIDGDASPLVSGEDGLAVLRIALAAKRSAQCGQTVSLPMTEKDA